MTQNQIAYWNYRESIRSNKARERETNRSNVARETETNRSNLANEKETQRSNLAREVETVRSNVAREVETTRHNVAMEMLDKTRLDEIERDNRARTTLNYQQHYETIRHNLATERYQQSQSVLGFANLGLGYYNANITAARDAETARHNRVGEVTNLMNLAETQRNNKERTQLGYDQLQETSEHNRATELAEQQRLTQNTRNWVLENNKYLEQSRHNQVVEQETAKHNRRNEMNDFIDTMGRSVKVLSDVGKSWIKGGLSF